MTGFAFGTLVPQTFLDLLVRRKLLTPQEAARVAEGSARAGSSVERTVLELGLAAEEPLFRALAEHLDLPFAEPGHLDEEVLVRTGLPADFLSRVEAVPARETEEVLWVATADPRGADAVQSIGFHLGRPVQAAIAAPSTIKAALAAIAKPAAAAGVAGTSETDIERLRALANDGPVIKLVNDLVAQAAEARASDIHIEAEAHGARIRLRIDGSLRTEGAIAEAQRAAVVSRLKVMANLNISEKRRPQDGRAAVAVRGRTVDIRLSTLPTQHGESVVLRLLDRAALRLDWEALGFPSARAAEVERILRMPNGLFLVAGPTGSGKTTTLYTALSRIDAETRKIVTVEDPIEYELKGVNQVQVEPAIDLTFARALRAILRQDPDVVMVGEIRDEETAEIAVRAALVDRLIDLGVPRYLLAATLRGVLSQRLVRRLCTACAGQGCAACVGSGRKGRIVVSELLRATPEVAASIHGTAGSSPLSASAAEAGFVPMAMAGRDLAARGLVHPADVEEALGAIDAFDLRQ
ncbi:MAG: Flp pilus assembly complex ATPase component TadA [Rhodobacteraceae bacterium]|nr:Flp pilus assembly complex ATPase component TadA [Paracoccaceae bacterium]